MQTSTETQTILSEIWMDVLQIKTIGLDDDFFEAGGDSLLALLIYDQVRLRFHREFPIFDLSNPPTIRNLAVVIDAEVAGTERNEYRSLQRIQKGDPSVTPLFLVHGGDGNARVFQRLAKNLDTRIPVYAFRWSGWDGKRGETSLSAMAEAYLRELLKFRPQGPYRIGGYCIGGMVALEVARMLKAEGQVLDGPLYIWDCPNSESAHYHRHEPWHSTDGFRTFRRMVGTLDQLRLEIDPQSQPLAVPTEYTGTYQLLRRYPSLYTFARSTQIVIGTIPMKIRLRLGIPVQIKWRWIYAMTTCYFAIQRHKPSSYDGDVVYLRSDTFLGRDMNLFGWWDDPFLGFRELCTGSFRGYVVGGDHVNVLGRKVGAKLVNKTYFKDKP